MDTFNVGDVCITQNARRAPAINDGTVVVVVGIDRAHVHPYTIRKLSGEPWPVCERGGRLCWGRFETVQAGAHHLRKPDLREGWTDQEAIEQRSLQRMLEESLRREFDAR